MSKEQTREGIARSHRLWNRVYIGWRVFAAAYFAFILWAVFVSGSEAYLLVYLILPPLWWALSTLWISSNDRLRDMRLRNLKFEEEWRR